MSIWGYFDDDNDETQQYWNDFMDKYANKYHKNIYKMLKSNKCDKYEDYYNKLEPELKKEKIKVAEHMIQFIKNKKVTGHIHKQRLQIGLINIIAKLKHKKFSSKLPTILFAKFPEELREIACKLIKSSLITDCTDDWKDIKKRKRALNKEAKLYGCK